MEHFFGTLKAESGYYDVNKHGLLSYQMMEELITDFIQFYNKDRIQKKIRLEITDDFQPKMCVITV